MDEKVGVGAPDLGEMFLDTDGQMLRLVLHAQVASALHNAENGWGPVNAAFLRNTGAPVPAPAQALAAVAAETAPRYTSILVCSERVIGQKAMRFRQHMPG